jgi:hypothetical protein
MDRLKTVCLHRDNDLPTIENCELDGLARLRPELSEHRAGEVQKAFPLSPLQGKFGETRTEGDAACRRAFDQPSGDKRGNDLICR